jgi:hypothetical protein
LHEQGHQSATKSARESAIIQGGLGRRIYCGLGPPHLPLSDANEVSFNGKCKN